MAGPALIGVLALQGGFEAHERMLRRAGADTRQVRVPQELAGLDGLVIPGGESTTMTLGIAIGVKASASRSQPKRDAERCTIQAITSVSRTTTVAAIAEAVIGPNPGMLISRRAVSSCCASFAMVRSSRAIASSRFRNCTTSGASASHTSNGIASSQASIRCLRRYGRR